MPSNTEAGQIFLRIAELMSYREEGTFKIRAYYRAALTLCTLVKPLAEIDARNELRELPGVGDAIASKIREILNTGTCALYERLIRETPEEIRALLRVPGLTPRLVRLLETEFEVQSVEALVEMVRSGGLEDLDGLEVKVEDAARILIAAEHLGALNAGVDAQRNRAAS
jgi:DNA polymerase (family 10)